MLKVPLNLNHSFDEQFSVLSTELRIRILVQVAVAGIDLLVLLFVQKLGNRAMVDDQNYVPVIPVVLMTLNLF